MNKREKIIKLYDIYSSLLTQKQKKIFEKYYYEDLSLSEISENEKISKSYVGKSLQNIINKLEMYEKNLKINHKNSLILNTINDEKTKKEIEKIINS